MKITVKPFFSSRLNHAQGRLVFAMTLLASPLASADNGWWNTADGN